MAAPRAEVPHLDHLIVCRRDELPIGDEQAVDAPRGWLGSGSGSGSGLGLV